MASPRGQNTSAGVNVALGLAAGVAGALLLHRVSSGGSSQKHRQDVRSPPPSQERAATGSAASLL